MVRGRSRKKREVKSVRKGWEVEERKAWQMSWAEFKEKQKIKHRTNLCGGNNTRTEFRKPAEETEPHPATQGRLDHF